ncbi:hypothetical protein AAVH_19227 [Aphelenchoides avenae]|nr:hypothetical protein AAVH_19227 [Aphelenchus avenae]
MYSETLYAYELDRRATEKDVRSLFDAFGNVKHVKFNDGKQWPRLAKHIYDDVGYGAFVTFDGNSDFARKMLHNSDKNPLTGKSHTITSKPLSWNGVAPGKTLHCRKVPGIKLVMETKGKNKGKPKILTIHHKL